MKDSALSPSRSAHPLSRWALLAALTLTGAALAQAPAPDQRVKFLNAMTQLGAARQVLSECAIPDSEVSGLAAAYKSALHLTDLLATQPSSTLNLSRTDIEAAFRDGMSESAAKGARPRGDAPN